MSSSLCCPIDGSTDVSVLERERLSYCRSCRHAWDDEPETPAQYENEYFNSVYSRPRAYDEWLLGRYRDILRTTRSFSDDLSRSLDVGCGQGEFVRFLGEQGIAAEGTETSVRYSDDCRSRGLVVHTGLSNDLENRDTRYDLVSCLHVMEHVENPLELLRSLRALTRPSGLIYIELPNELEAWRSRVKASLGRPVSTVDSRRRTGHRQCFTPRSIQRLAKRAGLDVLRTDTRDVIEPHASTAHRLVVATADLFARTSLLQGNVLRCWCRRS